MGYAEVFRLVREKQLAAMPITVVNGRVIKIGAYPTPSACGNETLPRRKGVERIVCQTCLDYFGLRDKVAEGIVGGMPDIIEAMQKAEKVVSL